MIFAYPAFLWALAAVAVPVIIHLFNFQRHKKIYFTNVRFLRQLEEETKSRSRLKEWLVLACRCLALTALVFAFSQPQMAKHNGTVKAGNRAVSIYIDNSFSMENVSSQGPLVDIARTRAKELVNAMGSGDKFQVITNDFEGKHQRFYSQEEIGRVIDEVRVSPAIKKLSDVVDRQAEFLRSSPLAAKRIYCISDAQRSTFDIADLHPDSTMHVSLLPLAGNQVNNVYIDSCWFHSPLQQEGFIQKLHVRIRNKGTAPIDIGSAKLVLNDRQVAVAGFSVSAGGVTETAFSFECKEEGYFYGSVRIEDFPVTFDDVLYFAFSSRISIPVCVVNGAEADDNSPLSALFTGDSLFQCAVMNDRTIDYSKFRTCDLLVLNGVKTISSGLLSEITKYSVAGGALVIIPPKDPDRQSYRDACAALKLPGPETADTMRLHMAEIPPSLPFFTGVFEKVSERINLPVVRMHFKIPQPRGIDFETLLRLDNGDIALGESRRGDARTYLFTFPFSDDATNFGRHALFVPVMYQIAFNSVRSQPLYYETASNAAIAVTGDFSPADHPPHIIGLSGEPDLIPGFRNTGNGAHLITQGQVTQPGFYKLVKDTANVMPLAFNYSRVESDLSQLSADQISDEIRARGFKNVDVVAHAEEGFSRQAVLGGEPVSLWKLFIFLALLFLLTEAALLRLLK